MKKLISILLILTFAILSTTAQVAINGDGTDPDNSAMLHIKSSSKGLLIPKMSDGQRSAISSPAEGLLVYQTNAENGLYINLGSSSVPVWNRIEDQSTKIWSYHSSVNIIYGPDNNTKLNLGGTYGDVTPQQLSLTKSMRIPSTTDATQGVIYKGTDPFIHNYPGAGGNTFIGRFSGNFTMSGTGDETQNNTCVGSNTLSNLTSGYRNIAVGSSALNAMENGHDNIGIGYRALFEIETGESNVAIGNYTLSESTTGNNNTAIGFNALKNNSGSGNIAVGGDAFLNNTSGNYNTIVGLEAGKGGSSLAVDKNVILGYRAGYEIQTGADNNIMVGYEAGEGFATGSDNILIGYQAGKDLGSGDDNILIGKKAGDVITNGSTNLMIGENAGGIVNTGSNNILIGYQAGDNITSGSDNIIIGYNLNANLATGDDQLSIGGVIYGDLFNKRVGIGTPTPAEKLHVRAVSGTCTVELESGAGRPILKMDAHSTTSNSEIQFEQDGTYMGAIGYNNNDDNIFFYEDGSMVFKNGKLGIAQTNPTNTLHLPNNASTGVALAYAWNTYSDKRVKSNVKTLDYGLNEILLLQPKSYMHHPQASEDDIMQIDRSTGTETIGLIAQEVYQVIPEAVRKPDNSDLELWSMDYAKLVPVLINGIKELSGENDELKRQNEELLRICQGLEGRIKALESNK